MTRSELNKQIGVLVHAKLKLDEDIYRQIVYSIDNNSGGFVRNCDDETANLVLIHLQRLADKKYSTHEVNKQSDQEKFVARLMDYLKWNWSNTSQFIFKITGKHHTSKCSTTELSKVIRGMVAIIDKDIECGKIVLHGETKMKYYRYTKNHRTKSTEADPSTLPTESVGIAQDDATI
ncbi:MAG: hypothetical protein Q8L88_02385 [Bacteroidota bacterium]|nr:hypothetical protein [Bacteroidota bacterium]